MNQVYIKQHTHGMTFVNLHKIDSIIIYVNDGCFGSMDDTHISRNIYNDSNTNAYKNAPYSDIIHFTPNEPIDSANFNTNEITRL